MERRTFLEALGGAALIPFVPSLASTSDNANLKAWFEKNFVCVKGSAQSWVEIKTGDGILRYAYYTYAAGILNGTSKEAKKQLTQHFINHFTAYAKDKPDLIWRVEPAFTSQEIVTYGNTWMTAEEIEDGSFDGKLHRYVAIDNKRIKAEEVTVPENVELDFDTGCYKYVNSKDTLHKMRFRLAIPKFQTEIETFAHIEGDPVEKI